MNKRPILILFLPFLLGIVLADRTKLVIPIIIFVLILLLLCIVSLLYRQNRGLYLVIITLLMLIIGWMRMQFSIQEFQAQSIHTILGQPLKGQLIGKIISSPETRLKGYRAIISVHSIIKEGSGINTNGKILFNWQDENGSADLGDIIQIPGTLTKADGQRNPGEFNYRDYLKPKGIAGLFYAGRKDSITVIQEASSNDFTAILFAKPRAAIESFFEQYLSIEHAGLLKGLILGLRGEIQPNVREAFADTGVVHILAVSGLHVGFVVVFLLLIARILRLKTNARLILLVIGLIYYAGLTGFKPPVVRAVLMAVLFLFATIIQRRADIYNILATAALVILVINPNVLFEIGFQLSFTAVFGIAFFYSRLSPILIPQRLKEDGGFRKIARWSLEISVVSLSAQIGTLPLTMIYFERIPLLSIPANLMVIPLVQAVVILGFILVGLSLSWGLLANLLGKIISLLLFLLTEVVSWLASFPFAKVETYQFSSEIILVSFVICIILVYLMLRRQFGWVIIAVLVLLTSWVWSKQWNKNLLTITHLDIGQGDAALIEQPGEFAFLIDAGPWTPNYDAGERTIVPYLQRRGISKLDAIFLSHPHTDHMGGVASLLNEIPVKEIFAVDPGSKKLYPDYRPVCDSLQIPVTYLTAGDTLNRFLPLKISILAPFSFMLEGEKFDANNRSMVIRIEYGKSKFLFCGDVEEKAEEIIDDLGLLLDVDVLKVPHHGSKTSSTEGLLDQVKPTLAIMSVGKWNRFNHPSEVVMARYDSLDIPYVRTDLNGAVIYELDESGFRRIR